MLCDLISIQTQVSYYRTAIVNRAVHFANSSLLGRLSRKLMARIIGLYQIDLFEVSTL